MDVQVSGLRKRKSLEEEYPCVTVRADYKSEHCKTEAHAQDAESLGFTGPAANIMAMDEILDVSTSETANKLSTAAVNVESKDDLVSQHAKVAEEAIAGWEKAEIEAMVLKQQLEAFAKKNSTLEDRANHLDGALKEVVSKLRQTEEEQEMNIKKAVLKEAQGWEFRKNEFANQILHLQSQIESYKTEVSSMSRKLDYLEKENSALTMQLRSQSEELEIRTIERDLSTEAAEKSSKQNLVYIKKVARLEAEYRKLRSAAHTSLSVSDRKSGAASSLYADSFSDSQSDSGERLQTADSVIQKNMTLKSTECLTSCSYSLTSKENTNMVNKYGGGSGIEMDLMDDFLEIERLAALPEIVNENHNEAGTINSSQSNSDEISLDKERSRADTLEQKVDIIQAEKADLETKFEKIKQQKAEVEENLKEALNANHILEEKLKRIEMEKSELQAAFAKNESSAGLLNVQLQESEMKLNELRKELTAAYETQQSYKSQVMGYELEAKIMSSRVESLETKLKMEKDISAGLTVKCEDIEDELFRTKQEFDVLQSTISSNQLKIKQDDLAAAAGKLAECQQTIASLGIQLKSLASLDDLLTDTANSQESIEILGPDNAHLLMEDQHDSSSKARKSRNDYKEKDYSPASSSSSSSTSSAVHVNSEKGRNGFIKLFSRSSRGKVSA